MKYQVRIGDRSYDVEVNDHGVTVDGRTHRAELRPVDGTPLQLLILDDRSLALPVESAGGGRWVLHHLGERVEADVVDERTRHIRSLVGPGTAHAATHALRAPMPGLVVRLLVEPGQRVTAGQGVLVLEAMKMENELKAGGDGVVDRIEVGPGQAVEKGAILVAFGAP